MWIDVMLEGFPSDGAIHGAGVDHDESEAFGEQAGEGAFAGCGGAIDGNREVGIGGRVHVRERVGRVKSEAFDCSLRMALRW